MNKEERILKYINSADELVFNGKRYYENDFYNDVENLVKETQELKAKIKTYEDPEDLTLMFMYCDEKAKDKIKELKKQLEDMTLCRDIASGHRKEVQDRETILLNQQKEFIEYLENEIESCELTSDLIFNHNKEMKIYKEILSKYKEIIGGKDE